MPIYLGSELYGHGILKNNFFLLDLNLNNSIICVASSSSNVMSNSVKWHARLGHIGQERMAELAREGLLALSPK